MKTCPNCGNQVADEALFCNNCGTNVGNVASNTVEAAGVTAAGADEQTQASVPFQPQVDPTQGFNGQQFQSQTYVSAVDPTDHTDEFDPRDIADNKLFAIMPYFASFLGVIIALQVKESAFCRFHAKNAIRITLCAILAVIPSIIPILGWAVTGILETIIVVVDIIAIVNVFKGKAKDLPIIGNIGFLK